MKSKKRPAFGESRVDDYTTVGYGVVSERAHEQKKRNMLQMGTTQSDLSRGNNSQQQPVIILQRSPNVVNHFSVAPTDKEGQLPSIQPQRKIDARRVTHHSDQKDSTANVTEALNMLSLRPQLKEFATSNDNQQ